MSLDDTTLERPAADAGPALGQTAGWTALANDPKLALQTVGPTVTAYHGGLYAYGGDGGDQVLCSADGGASWTAVQGDFPARQGGAGATFRDMMYLVGGVDRADTWASKDDMPGRWFQVDGAAPWGPRFGHTLIPYREEQLFLIAGVKSTRPHADVWFLTEGLPWTQQPATGLTERVDAAGAALGDLLVVMGGNCDSGAIADASVSSDRGATWTSRPVPWAARWGARAVTLGDTLYLIGGQDRTQVFNDVWSTRDAISWTRVENAPWQALTGFGAGASNDHLVALGGQTSASANPQAWSYSVYGWKQIGESDITAVIYRPVVLELGHETLSIGGNPSASVFVSADGVTWSPASSHPGDRIANAGALHNDEPYTSGGVGPHTPTQGCREVWRQPTGQDWTLVTDQASWPERTEHGMASFDGKLWVIGGRAGNLFRSDIWCSDDNGASWRQEAAPAGFVGRCAFGTIVFAGKLWVLGGQSQRELLNDVWSRDASGRWTQYTAPWFPRSEFATQVLGERLYIVSGVVQGVASHCDVWATGDGINWTLVDRGAPPYEGFGTTVKDGAILLFGGTAAGVRNRAIYRYLPPPA